MDLVAEVVTSIWNGLKSLGRFLLRVLKGIGNSLFRMNDWLALAIRYVVLITSTAAVASFGPILLVLRYAFPALEVPALSNAARNWPFWAIFIILCFSVFTIAVIVAEIRDREASLDEATDSALARLLKKVSLLFSRIVAAVLMVIAFINISGLRNELLCSSARLAAVCSAIDTAVWGVATPDLPDVSNATARRTTSELGPHVPIASDSSVNSVQPASRDHELEPWLSQTPESTAAATAEPQNLGQPGLAAIPPAQAATPVLGPAPETLKAEPSAPAPSEPTAAQRPDAGTARDTPSELAAPPVAPALNVSSRPPERPTDPQKSQTVPSQMSIAPNQTASTPRSTRQVAPQLCDGQNRVIRRRGLTCVVDPCGNIVPNINPACDDL
ncbi:hypothetical protein [Paracoccus fistulariae]|uniref:Uncharacterized protein n=2 Tax=Paracoccus fistulariae TaxID=658446 RepID=A0ABY7SPD8_9RHOB|nr:hypothetical protein [Paracoccus fistulariae]WCR08851.1 hypothetical protein JHX87_08700 [Paracoccus fistulariae]